LSVPAEWLTVDDVGAYLDLPSAVVAVDDNLALSTAAVKAAVEQRRSDLFDDAVPPVFTPGDDVKGGSVIWAALVYQYRSSPSGYTGYGGDEGSLMDPLGSRRAEVMRLIGWRRPVAI
jgi:hypothetical protein